jgi:hypothetical protein
MLRQLILLFVTIVLSSISWGQVVYIQFVDTKSGENIQNVNVLAKVFDANAKVKDSTFYLRSSGKGIASFKLENVAIGTILNLNCSHPVYDDYTKILKTKSLTDTLKVTLFLQATKSLQLKEVVVKAPGIPDTVFRSERLSVADFEVLPNGDLLILAYPKQLHKGHELILFDGQKTKSKFALDDQAQYLTKDYRGNIHLIGKEKVFGILIQKNEIGIAQLTKDYFFKYVAPIVDTNSAKLFFTTFNKDYPAFDYLAVDLTDSTYKTLLHIQDDLMMELYRSEYKWVDVRSKLWAREKERDTGIDKEIWIGANFFTQSIYYKEVYAPLFQCNDSIFIFNYPKDLLETYDKHGNFLSKNALTHHYQAKKTGFKRHLIQDKVTGCIYAHFEKDGFSYLGLIDRQTGQISEKVQLHFKYVEKIRVHDNQVFYVYRPFESLQKKFLYREQLPYSMKPQKVNQGTAISIDTGK